jgi:lysophospholipase L1-like esterase
MTTLSEIPEAERSDPYVLSPDEAAELVAGHPWSRLVMIGDSVAKGIGSPTEGYANVTVGERVAAALAASRPDLTSVNLGERGLKAAEVRDAQLARALELRPDLAGVIAGGNDMFQETFDVEPVKAVLEGIVTTLQEAGATVMTFEVLDLPGAFGEPFAEADRRLSSLHEALREIAAEHGTIHVDAYTQPWSRDRDCMSDDYQHASMRGQALAASETIRTLGAYLREDRG